MNRGDHRLWATILAALDDRPEDRKLADFVNG
jgi:hypothetical protein